VDTLDNVAGLRTHGVGKGQHYGDLLGALSEENVERIRRQNKKKISVIIGNPPYNANQLNENENNKNREYPLIDKRIRETYVALRDSHKTKTYDMYVRKRSLSLRHLAAYRIATIGSSTLTRPICQKNSAITL
jgi:predicted helicase